MTDLLVIGGGAAGLMAAGAACARGLTVTVLEHNPKGPGQKLLITGKGRCNVTSDSDVREFLPYVRHNGRFLYSSLYAFPPSAAMELFESLGVPLKTERGRRVFPRSDRAADVLAALRDYARDAEFMRGSAKKLVIEDGVCKGAVTDRGETLRQETRGWNDDSGESYLMRTKEQAHDYRYFPDPDLMPVTFTDAEIEAIRAELPELPAAMRERFLRDYGLTEYDAGIMTQDRALAAWFDRAAKASKSPKLVANWIGSELLRMLGEAKCPIDECRVTPENLAELVDLIEQKTINGKIAKEVFPEMFETGRKASEIVKAKGLVQVSDSGAIAEVGAQAVAANPAQVEQYRSGNAKVLQFLVGQVMKLSKGKANPQLVVAELKKQLD